MVATNAAPHDSPPASPAAAREFERMCIPHRSALFATAMRLLRQPDDAHDLVQETYMRALDAWPRLRPSAVTTHTVSPTKSTPRT